MFYFDINYLFIMMPAIIFALWASSNVSSTFNKYQKVRSLKGITGSEAARLVLDKNGLTDVKIERVAGKLSDHYDPRTRVVRLSSEVHDGTSVASIGVACHEVGHAIQHSKAYKPLVLRNAIIPITNIGSTLSMPLVLLGLVLSAYSNTYISIAYIGIICFAACVVFQLLTLSTEFDASNRALKTISSYGILDEEEMGGTKKVLKAAALTYVAALAHSLAQLLYLFTLVNRRNND